MTIDSQQFASDNYAGICPEAWAAMAEANQGHAPAYGDDAWTSRAADAFRKQFETGCEVFFAFNGTAANALALAALCQSARRHPHDRDPSKRHPLSETPRGNGHAADGDRTGL